MGEQARQGPRQVCPLHQLLQVCPQGQGDPEVCDQEHCGGCRRQGHLRGERLHQLPAAQAVRQALLLRLLRYPLQGGKEQVARVEKGQNSATEVWIPESSAAAGTSVGGPAGGTVGGGVGKVVGGGVGKAVGGAVGESVETHWTKGGVEPATPETKKKRGVFDKVFKKEKSPPPAWYSSTNSLDSEANISHHSQTTNPKLKDKSKQKAGEKAICEETKIQDEAKTVMSMVRSYLDIVHTTMMDLAPKYIVHFLVRALQKYLEEDILGKLLELHSNKEGVDQLMQWNAGSQVSELLADRKAIREALEVVAGYSQNRETVTTAFELDAGNWDNYKNAEAELALLLDCDGSPDAIDIAARTKPLDFNTRERVIQLLQIALANARKQAQKKNDNHAGHMNRITKYTALITYLRNRQNGQSDQIQDFLATGTWQNYG